MVYGEYLVKTRGIFQLISASDLGCFPYNGSSLFFFDSHVLLSSCFLVFRIFIFPPSFCRSYL